MKNIVFSIALIFLVSNVYSQFQQVGQVLTGEGPENAIGGLGFPGNVSLSEDGRYVAFGLPGNSKNGKSSGSVQIYKFNGTSWSALPSIYGQNQGDNFGLSVKLIVINGDPILAVGAPGYNLNSNIQNSGQIKIFKYSGSWQQLGKNINGANHNDQLGYSLDLEHLEGEYWLVAGAPEGINSSYSGYTNVYYNNESDWKQYGSSIIGKESNNLEGSSVSIALTSFGYFVSTGARHAKNKGTVRVFQLLNDKVNEIQEILGKQDNEFFGTSMDFSKDGKILIVGGSLRNINNGDQQGIVRTFSYNTSKWIQTGIDLVGKISTENAQNVSINNNGQRISIGAPGGNSNKINSGIASIFDYKISTWSQYGSSLAGNNTGDYFGHSVSLSGTGDLIAVYSPLSDLNGSNSGSVNIYDLNKLDGNKCNSAIELTCSQVYKYSNLNSPNNFNISDYSCYSSNSSFNANDIVFKYIHNENHPNANVVIWNFTKDLDIFLLNECNSISKCIRHGNNSSEAFERIDFTSLPYGEYFIVIDGYNDQQTSNFEILVSCQYLCNTDGISENIQCGEVITGTTSNSVHGFSKYSCSSTFQFTGPEKYYKFTAESDGEYLINLDGFTNDLELFVLDNPNCKQNPSCLAFSTNSKGKAEQINITLIRNQTIFIVIDGALGNEGTFKLKITCPVQTLPLVFKVQKEICGDKNSMIMVPVTVSNFTSIRSFSMSINSQNPNIARIIAIHSTTLTNLTSLEITSGKTFGVLFTSDKGVSISDNSIAFNLEVLIQGEVTQSSEITFSSSPVAIKAAVLFNHTTSPVQVVVEGASVCVINSMVELKGIVKTTKNLGIHNAMVHLTNTSIGSIPTDQNGQYQYTVPRNSQYEIKIVKMANPKNGIDIFDLAAIQDHIITRKIITDPYQLLAGDVNGDGVIDIFDLADLQDVIITRKSNFHNEQSWIFLPTDEILTADKLKNNTYKTMRTVDLKSTNLSELDFYGIKLGDLAEELANPNEIKPKIPESEFILENRQTSQISLKIPSFTARMNEIVHIPVFLEKFQNIRAFQFELQWDPALLKYDGIQDIFNQLDAFSVNNILYDATVPGKLYVLWINPENKQVNDHSILFKLRFIISGKPGESIPINFLNVKAGDISGPVSILDISHGVVKVGGLSTKMNNKYFDRVNIKTYPNPVRQTLMINAPIYTEIKQIVDISGKAYLIPESKGYTHQIEVSFLNPGIYFIQLLNSGSLNSYKFIKAE